MRVTSSPVPRPSRLQPLLDRRVDLTAKLERTKRLVRSQSDPSIVNVRRQIASLDGQIAVIQGYTLPTATGGPGGPPPPPANRWLALIPGAANYDQFLQVGHCLAALLAGGGGAVYSAHLYLRRGRQPPAPDTGSADP
jgi:hypothetical protein